MNYLLVVVDTQLKWNQDINTSGSFIISLLLTWFQEDYDFLVLEYAYSVSFTIYSRDGPSNSNLLPDQNPSEAIRNDERLNGDFLTLAPPSAASPPLNSHQKHSLDYSQVRTATIFFIFIVQYFFLSVELFNMIFLTQDFSPPLYVDRKIWKGKFIRWDRVDRENSLSASSQWTPKLTESPTM